MAVDAVVVVVVTGIVLATVVVVVVVGAPYMTAGRQNAVLLGSTLVLLTPHAIPAPSTQKAVSMLFSSMGIMRIQAVITHCHCISRIW